jgi:hypothetical protein
MTRSRRHSQLLIDHGRKAGLNTGELYSALAGRPVVGTERSPQADCNGFVAGINPQGRRIYRPVAGDCRS